MACALASKPTKQAKWWQFLLVGLVFAYLFLRYL